MVISAPPKLHVIHVPGVDPIRDAAVIELENQTEICLHVDPERKGVMWNWAQAMWCINGESSAWDWHFVVQDDMAPYRGWMQHLERATQQSPSRLLGLCWIGDRWSVGARGGYPFMVGPNILRGGAVAYHRSCFPSLADFAQRASWTDYPHDDMAACVWAQATQNWEPALVSRTLFNSMKTRSLVGHARYDTGTETIVNGQVDWAAHPRSTRVTFHADPATPGFVHPLIEKMEAMRRAARH